MERARVNTGAALPKLMLQRLLRLPGGPYKNRRRGRPDEECREPRTGDRCSIAEASTHCCKPAASADDFSMVYASVRPFSSFKISVYLAQTTQRKSIPSRLLDQQKALPRASPSRCNRVYTAGAAETQGQYP